MILVGRTGAGKSYLGRRFINGLSRLVVFDPKGTLATGWNLEPWSDKGERALLEGKPVRLRVPAPLDGQWDGYAQTIYHAGNCTLYIDEAYGVVPPGKRIPEYLNALYTRGRELRIGVWAATQRPTWVPLVMLSEAEWLFVFRLQMAADRQRMAELMGPEVENVVKDKHGFYAYNVEWNKPRYFRGIS